MFRVPQHIDAKVLAHAHAVHPLDLRRLELRLGEENYGDHDAVVLVDLVRGRGRLRVRVGVGARIRVGASCAR